MAETNSTDFTLKRCHGITCVSRFLASGVMSYHRLCIEGGEHLPKEGPALLLPKHRAYRDILLEGVVLYQVTRRYANYVMKVGLYGVLEFMGGVKIVRPKDVRRLKDREARKAQIQWAREKNQVTMEYLTWLYSRDEIIISHPEGMRFQDAKGPMQKEVIDHLLQVEEELGRQIPIIPIGLEYESYSKPRSPVFFRIDAPLYAAQFADVNELMKTVDERIGALSGFGAAKQAKI